MGLNYITERIEDALNGQLAHDKHDTRTGMELVEITFQASRTQSYDVITYCKALLEGFTSAPWNCDLSEPMMIRFWRKYEPHNKR